MSCIPVWFTAVTHCITATFYFQLQRVSLHHVSLKSDPLYMLSDFIYSNQSYFQTLFKPDLVSLLSDVFFIQIRMTVHALRHHFCCDAISLHDPHLSLPISLQLMHRHPTHPFLPVFSCLTQFNNHYIHLKPFSLTT